MFVLTDKKVQTQFKFKERSDIDFNCEFNLSDDIDRLIYSHFKNNQLYEPEVVSMLLSFLKEGDTFIDVGSHLGFFSLLASSIVGKTGNVYAFEAGNENFAKLEQNKKINNFSHLNIFHNAVSDKKELVKFYFNSDNDGGHALWDVAKHPYNEKSKQNADVREIESVTLDELIGKPGIEKTKIIKIDTEGAEAKILRGAENFIKKTEVPIIIGEYNKFGLKTMGDSEFTLRNLMRKLGYRTYLFFENKLIKIEDDLVIYEKYPSEYVVNLFFTNFELLTQN